MTHQDTQSNVPGCPVVGDGYVDRRIAIGVPRRDDLADDEVRERIALGSDAEVDPETDPVDLGYPVAPC